MDTEDFRRVASSDVLADRPAPACLDVWDDTGDSSAGLTLLREHHSGLLI